MKLEKTLQKTGAWLVLLLLLGQNAVAQKKVLGKPEFFKMPVDYFDQPESYTKLLNYTKNKDGENAWLVTSDRNNNPVYEKPDLSSNKVTTVSFREYFYVVEEKDDWVKIIDAQVDELKIINKKREMGWMPKKNLLLWNSGIVGLNTQIHKKILLLNRVDDINNVAKLEDKVKVKLFAGPTAGNAPLADLQIFDYYFIMKKENGMILISQESEISPLTIEKLVGWVDERRCSQWNTRICLEPNFDENAFAERKANPKYRMRAFDGFDTAKSFAEEGGAEKGVYWKDDPVGIPAGKLANENARRFKGAVVRFPMISVVQGAQPGFNYLRSGVIGSIKVKQDEGFKSEIGEVDYSNIEEYVNNLEYKANNLNIFFVIEGTDSTYSYKNHIIQAINHINNESVKGVANVKYGALIYRDLPEEKTPNGNRLTEFYRLSRNFDNLIGFIQKAEFRNYNDRDEYTALYHGMMQALTQGGFSKDEQNIIVMIGSYGDFKIDKERKKQAQADGKSRMIYDDLTPIYQNINELDAHVYSVQLRNDGTKPSNGFAKQSQIIILESAKFAYNKYYGNRSNAQTQELLNKLSTEHKVLITEPYMPDVNEGANDLKLVGGRFPGRLLRPAAGGYLPPAALANILKDDVAESVQFTRTFRDVVKHIFVTGQSADAADIQADLKVDAGRFAPALASFLNEMIKDDQVANKDLYNALYDKYKLFADVYFPTKINGAQHPTVSYVLFMPESDLVEYRRLIERSIVTESSYDKKRERLFEIYKELIVSFSGETGLRNKKPDDVTRSELIAIMQGLYGSGLQIDVPLDVRIGDIRDEKKVTNTQIDELLQNSKRVADNLASILRKADGYDFCYTSESGNRYYWIPLSEAF